MKIELYYVAHYTYVMGQLRTVTFDDYVAALEHYQKKKTVKTKTGEPFYMGLKLFKQEIVDTELLCAGHTRPDHHDI